MLNIEVLMGKIIAFFKEIKQAATEVKRDLEIYLFLRRYIARSRFQAK